jgi:hypothetical protein
MRIDLKDTSLAYYLVSFDKSGEERRDEEGLESERLLQMLADEAQPITDVFFVSHGWKGDIPAAIEQCNKWMGAMAAMAEDRKAIRAKVPGFRALLVGIHWPSQAWGDEDIAVSGAATPGFLGAGANAAAADNEAVIDRFAEAISTAAEARQAIALIVRSAADHGGDRRLDDNVRGAYETLLREADVWSDDAIPQAYQIGAWNAQNIVDASVRAHATPGVLGWEDLKDSLLSPLRQLTFWTMKARAKTVGEIGVGRLLRMMQRATPRPVRFHLMGHSFGCIVSSAAVAGKNGELLARPVNSLFLVQGALSLWAYGRNESNGPGYFECIIQESRVAGPIVTTWSTHDGAVGNLYPLAARLARQKTLAVYPEYGGVGAFGLQGVADGAVELDMGYSNTAYGFKRSQVYNLDASEVIKNGTGISGAHSDIAHPEVAHAAWEAIRASL